MEQNHLKFPDGRTFNNTPHNEDLGIDRRRNKLFSMLRWPLRVRTRCRAAVWLMRRAAPGPSDASSAQQRLERPAHLLRELVPHQGNARAFKPGSQTDVKSADSGDRRQGG
eukprot:795791-Pleurochrysis_carterae.AAC.4